MEKKYSIISEKDNYTDFGVFERDIQFDPSVNTKLDVRYNKINILSENRVEILMVFKFDHLPDRYFEVYQMYGGSEVIVRDYDGEIDHDKFSDESIAILADLYKIKTMKFYDEMKPKFLMKFGYDLLGSGNVSIEEAANQVKMILEIFDDLEKERNKNQ